MVLGTARRPCRTAVLVVAVVIAGAVVIGLLVGLDGTSKPYRPVLSGGRSPSRPEPALMPMSQFAKPLAGRPVDAASDQLVANLVKLIHTHFGAVAVNGLPLFTVGPSQQPVTVAVTAGCDEFTIATGEVPIPQDAYTTDPQYEHDSAMVVYQPSTHQVWELWEAKRSAAGAWSACAGGRLDTAVSNGVFPNPYGLSASGVSYFATMVTESDIEHGSIDHALAIDVPACNRYQAPAVRGDCGSDPGQLAEGSELRLPARLAMPSGLTPFGRDVFRALQIYGAVVTDQAGAVSIQAESAADWQAAGHQGADPITVSWAGKPEYGALDGVPWQSLQVVTPPPGPQGGPWPRSPDRAATSRPLPGVG